MNIDIIKILLPAVISFLVGVTFTPLFAHYLYTYKLWKKKGQVKSLDGQIAILTETLREGNEHHTPRLGGVVIWVSVFITALLFWSMGHFFTTSITAKLDFISRKQTWLPLLGILVGAFVGGIDDILVTEGFKNSIGKMSSIGTYIGGGLSFPLRLGAVATLGMFAGSWFYFKLDVDAVYMPFYGHIHLGMAFIALFILVTVMLFSTSVIDGIDGLSGGIFSFIFTAYGVIALISNQIDISALCFVIVGGILAFLWFNVPPALFYMSETGIMALLLALSVISFMTDAVLFLPIIAFPLLATSLSVITQLLSKKFLKRKIFLVAPLHHHFEAKGWPKHRIVMRYWIVSFICALLGIVVFLIA